MYGNGPLRLDEALQQRVEILAREAGMTPEAYLREAVERFADEQNGSRVESRASGTLFDAFSEDGLVGCLTDAPADLNTSKTHFEGFGGQ